MFTERKWVMVVFGLASLLISSVSAISYQNATQLIESTNKSKQTYDVIKNLVDIFASMTVAESGRRGYVFLRDEQELYRYQGAIQKIEPEFQALRQQLADNPSQQQQLMRLQSLIAQRVALLKQSIALYQTNKSALPTQLQITNQSVKLRNEIQALITEMQNEEERLLQQWLRQSQSSIHYRILIEILLIFSTFAILITVYTLLLRQLLKRQKSEKIQHKLAEDKELGELKLRFFSMISHEFRTPLSIILGSAQLLAESGQTWTEARKIKNLRRIQTSAKLMTQLLTDILTITRAEAGKLECHPEPLDLESFCLNLVEDIQFSSSKEHSIKFTSLGQCSHANLDEKLLYSVLSNLLANAIKYSAPKGMIQLILRCDPNATIFQVKDEGIGITLEDQQHLYEPFYRGQNVENIVGTGLGLAVVKKCLDLHNGEMTVDSVVGVGTTFTVMIPHPTVTVA